MVDDYLRQYGLIALLAGAAVAVPAGMLLLSWAATLGGIRPRRPNPVKSELYECGMRPIGEGRWTQFNFRYYMFAVLFVIFDVETIFIYPWAIRYKALGLFAFVEMMVFLSILVLGWAYAWRKRALEWRL